MNNGCARFRVSSLPKSPGSPVYLTKAIETLRKRGEEIPEATVAHIAPLGWEHIRLIGDYHFTPQSGRSLENLRPLRFQEEDESGSKEKSVQ
ncbi:Tn3 family transposase [Ktedonobacter racemifer]|uniref:Tn3 family transposase n=1 Tax=Ktedonobacter racemifer TaxID=363277 RepID=UPI00094897E7